MKRILARITILSIVLASSVTQSCTDLDENLYDQISEENFYKTDEEVIAALGPAYTTLYGWMENNSMFPIIEVSSDEIVVPQRGADWGDGGKWIRLHQHKWEPTEDYINSTWGLLYQGVANCNRLIGTFESSTSEVAKGYIPELKVLRAFYYYYLMDLFGSVPLTTKLQEPPAKSPRIDIYNFIETEITQNVDLLPKEASLKTYGRVNYYVGQTILAKMYLNAEVYTGTPQWQKAADACQKVLDGPYSIESDYKTNFLVNNQVSKEIIFAIPYHATNAPGMWVAQVSLHSSSVGTFDLATTPWNGFSAMEEMYTSYIDPVKNPGPQGTVIGVNGLPTTGTTDYRLQNFVVGPQKIRATGADAIDPDAEADDPNGKPMSFTPKIRSLSNAYRQDGARIGKWEFESGAAQNMNNDFAIFRLADVQMMRAEALWRLNPASTEALDLVNEIRTRAKVTPFVALTAENLLAERGRELWAESHRRTDLIRFGKFNDAWWEKPASEAYKKVFPIPRAQLQVNSKLEQNEGYPE
jgi:starch-binding outer membrane protein, SusD/RagB family